MTSSVSGYTGDFTTSFTRISSSLNTSGEDSNDFEGVWRNNISINYSAASMVAVTAVLLVMVITTAFGNFLVGLALFRYRSLRTVSNFLIGNLALSDFLLATTILPLSTINECLGHWVFGRNMCNLWLSLDVLYCTASIWNLCMIAFDRYTATLYPLWYREKRSAKQAAVYVSIVWVVALAICVPPVLGWGELSQNYFYNNSTQVYQCVLFQTPGYVVYSASGSFYIPFLLTFFLYVRIFGLLRQRMRKMAKAREMSRSAATRSRRHGISAVPPGHPTGENFIPPRPLSVSVGTAVIGSTDNNVQQDGAAVVADTNDVRSAVVENCVENKRTNSRGDGDIRGANVATSETTNCVELHTLCSSNVALVKSGSVDLSMVEKVTTCRTNGNDLYKPYDFTSTSVKNLEMEEEEEEDEYECNDSTKSLVCEKKEPRRKSFHVTTLYDDASMSGKQFEGPNYTPFNNRIFRANSISIEPMVSVERQLTAMLSNTNQEFTQRNDDDRRLEYPPNWPEAGVLFSAAQIPSIKSRSRGVKHSSGNKNSNAESTALSSQDAATTEAESATLTATQESAKAAAAATAAATETAATIFCRESRSTSRHSDTTVEPLMSPLTPPQPSYLSQQPPQTKSEEVLIARSAHIPLRPAGGGGEGTGGGGRVYQQHVSTIHRASLIEARALMRPNPTAAAAASAVAAAAAATAATATMSPKLARTAAILFGRAGEMSKSCVSGPSAMAGTTSAGVGMGVRGRRGADGGGSLGAFTAGILEARLHRRMDQRELRATVRMAIIISMFCGMWIGFFVIYVLRGWCPVSCSIPREVEAFFFWLGYSNSSINPVLYTLFNDDFRRAFNKILRRHAADSCCCCCGCRSRKRRGEGESDAMGRRRWGGARRQNIRLMRKTCNDLNAYRLE